MKFIHLLIFIFFFNCVFSQNKPFFSNEEYAKLQNKARININNSIDSSFYYANKIEKSNNNLQKAFAKGIKSYLFQLKNDSIQSNQNYVLASQLINNSTNSREKIRTSALLHNYKGLTDWKRRKYSNALKEYFKAKELAVSIDEKQLILTINNNIALIYADIRDYDKAIEITKQSDEFIDKNPFLFDDEKLKLNKGLIYLNLGIYYVNKYNEISKKLEYLDSSVIYHKKCIVYAKDIIKIKLKAEMNLATVFQMQGNLNKSQAYYLSSLTIAKSNNLEIESFLLLYNLAYVNYEKKEYSKAITYFKKVDSIYSKNKSNPIEYIKSNYYQALIYNLKRDNEKALFHSKIYLNNYEKNEFKINNEIVRVNDFVSNQEVKKEILKIYKNSEKEQFFKNIFISISIFMVIILMFFLKRKIDSEKRIKYLLEKYKANDLIIKENMIHSKTESNSNKVSSNALINEEKEEEILEKLKDLEQKKYYLKQDFSQTLVAKKIKTNTTYISFVVNKYYNKSFSEYANELRINYVINEIISNPTYRKYSTQAIAESVGYKNNVSFTKSFNKRTGFTPAQFIKKIENKI